MDIDMINAVVAVIRVLIKGWFGIALWGTV